jgi:hypothetical protein
MEFRLPCKMQAVPLCNKIEATGCSAAAVDPGNLGVEPWRWWIEVVEIILEVQLTPWPVSLPMVQRPNAEDAFTAALATFWLSCLAKSYCANRFYVVGPRMCT